MGRVRPTFQLHGMHGMELLGLLVGIKRRVFRENDPRAMRADAEFAAKRPGVLSKHQYTCAACQYISRGKRSLDVHHVDDDHSNNSDANLLPACHTCHPYQHVGEVARHVDVVGEGLGRQTVLAAIPEISPRDMNLLQRAIGAALLDEGAREDAEKIQAALARRASHLMGEFGTFKPEDFAAGMARLDDSAYAARGDVLSDLRLLFAKTHLERLGREWKEDYPSMPVSSFGKVAEGTLARRSVATGT